MLWHALQNHGAMIRDSARSGNTVIIQADQDVNGNDPLILGMEQYGTKIMAQAQILANQGPNSINGGGTPIVPLDPARRATRPARRQHATPTPHRRTTRWCWPGPPTRSPTPTGAKWTITASGQVAVNGTSRHHDRERHRTGLRQQDGLAGERQRNVVGQDQRHCGMECRHQHQPAAGADHHRIRHRQRDGHPKPGLRRRHVGQPHAVPQRSGDIVNLSGGANTITDSGSGNTYILPAAGNGTDTFSSNILTTGDTLDLKTALAATDWNGSAATLANYLTVTDSASAATLSISATSGGSATVIATINGASTVTLSSLLAHAIT